MTRYARDDMSCITISPETGGCGQSHSRPVIQGAPVKTWALDCPPCEAVLAGAHKPKILKYQTDRKTGQVTHQERVADADPMWSSTPDTIPLSPDQERTHALQIERGERQLRALESIASLERSRVNFRDRPDVLFYLREQELPEDILQGIVLCANDHPNPAGAKFCNECAISMATRGALEQGGGADGEAVVDLGRLHVQTLRKRCRDAGLPDKGSKEQLISRLQAAA